MASLFFDWRTRAQDELFEAIAQASPSQAQQSAIADGVLYALTAAGGRPKPDDETVYMPETNTDQDADEEMARKRHWPLGQLMAVASLEDSYVGMDLAELAEHAAGRDRSPAGVWYNGIARSRRDNPKRQLGGEFALGICLARGWYICGESKGNYIARLVEIFDMEGVPWEGCNCANGWCVHTGRDQWQSPRDLVRKLLPAPNFIGLPPRNRRTGRLSLARNLQETQRDEDVLCKVAFY